MWEIVSLALLAPMLNAVTPATMPAPRPATQTTEDSDAEVAVAWFEALYDVVRRDGIQPPEASRIYGYSTIALYESVVPGSRRSRSLGGQLNGLEHLPAPRELRLSWPSAANAALAETVRGLIPGASPASRRVVNDLEEFIAAGLKVGVPPAVQAVSEAHGRAVAGAVLAWAARDGFAENHDCAYTPAVGAGLWEPTPPGFRRDPDEPCWGKLRPFVLRSAEECAAQPPPEYSTDSDSPFYAGAKEVLEVSRNLTLDQTVIARYWADGVGVTGTPPGHWIAIVSQLARNHHLSLMRASEAYARVGMAMADAFIACWKAKYDYTLVRPVTYIRANMEPGWLPLLPTPAFPEHTSGHATQSGAAATVLSDLFGTVSFTDTTHVDHGLSQSCFASRTYASFEQAAEEAAASRLYGGIHYRTGNDYGLDQGCCVGRTIVERVRFAK